MSITLNFYIVVNKICLYYSIIDNELENKK